MPVEVAARGVNSLRLCTFGDLGSGKTLVLVKEALRYYLAKRGKVYSNIELVGIDYEKICSAEMLFDLKVGCFVLLDELWHMADSRKGMSVVNDVMNMLMLRSRKRSWFVGYSEQWYTQLDLRIRFITDLWIQPQIARDILREDIYNKNADFLATRFYEAKPLFKYYDSYADPFTLDVEALRGAWETYKRRGR